MKEHIVLSGNKKPIVIYSDNHPRPDNTDVREFMVLNQILNNYHDINYYIIRMKRPSLIAQVCNDPGFHSVGHSYSIAYGAAIGILATTFDNKFSFLPNPTSWEENFNDLIDRKVSGFYQGENIGIPPIGLSDLYEGQARFNQMLYLHIISNKSLDFYQFKQAGMLHGVYISAFNVFLDILDEKKPKSVDSPLVALFLLLIDIAINPAEGFPCGIDNFELFIEHTDPGIRFIHLCAVVKNQFPEFKELIDDYSAEKYWVISTLLCEAIGVVPPIEYLSKFEEWFETEESIEKLMKENEEFSFEQGNLLVRLIFARFLSFQRDKANNPEFFCWPGAYIEGERRSNVSDYLYVKHQALFKENINMDIAPSMLPGIDERTLEDTAGDFYLAVALFDLCQQWISAPGEFKYNYNWLSKSYSSEEMEDWAKSAFIQTFGVSPDDFEIVTPNKVL